MNQPEPIRYLPGTGLAVVRGGVAVLLAGGDRALAARCHAALGDSDPVEGVLALLLGHGLYAAPSFAIARLGEPGDATPARFVVRGTQRVVVTADGSVSTYTERRGVADRDCAGVESAVFSPAG